MIAGTLPIDVTMKFTPSGFPKGFLVWPLVLNGVIAAMTLWKGHAVYPNDIWACYVVAVVSILGAGTCLFEFLDVDFDPGKVLAAMFCHGAALILTFAAMYRAIWLFSNGKPVEVEFPTALYFSIVTWTTLGYGDFAPPPEIRLIAAFEAGAGLIFFGLLIGVAVALITKEK